MIAQPYHPSHLAVLVPTKDRPHKVRDLLESLAAQSQRPGRVVFIDGGAGIKELIESFADRLPVEHHVCRPPGQIRQRNMGIALLDDRTPLVASLDDDIVLEPGAIEAMLACWNRSPSETAGVGFNIINGSPEPRNWIRDLFLLSGPHPGRVLRSGATTSNCQIREDIQSEWLCGGATVWRLEILRTWTHRDIRTKWAIAEDIVFSYPISRKHPLVVCASARVRHEHVHDYRVKQVHRFHGGMQTLMTMHFVESNASLSRAAFLWMMTGAIGGRVLAGILLFRRRYLEFALGQLQALGRGYWAIARGRPLADVIERFQ